MNSVYEVGAQKSYEGVEAFRGRAVVGRVVVRLDGQQHFGQEELEKNIQVSLHHIRIPLKLF